MGIHLKETRSHVWTERRDDRHALDSADVTVDEGGKRALGLGDTANGDHGRQRHRLRELWQGERQRHTLPTIQPGPTKTSVPAFYLNYVVQCSTTCGQKYVLSNLLTCGF